MLTEADVRFALGLQDNTNYRIAAMWETINNAHTFPHTMDPMKFIFRRTGRTTQTCVEVIVKAFKGDKVLILCADAKHQDFFQRRLFGMLKELRNKGVFGYAEHDATFANLEVHCDKSAIKPPRNGFAALYRDEA